MTWAFGDPEKDLLLHHHPALAVHRRANWIRRLSGIAPRAGSDLRIPSSVFGPLARYAGGGIVFFFRPSTNAARKPLGIRRDFHPKPSPASTREGVQEELVDEAAAFGRTSSISCRISRSRCRI